MKLRTILNADVVKKRVLLRVDYNVSFDKNKNISDTTRIDQTLPTIRHLLERDNSLILVSHMGRPKGERDKKLSLKKVSKLLSSKLNREVKLTEHNHRPDLKERIALLENIRFHPGEESNDPEFAKSLAKMGDIFVNDAFGTAHRAHASTVGIADHLPAYAGLLFAKEVKILTGAITQNNGRLCVVIGGAKTPDKLRVIDNLLDRSHSILLGGAVANTFLSTWGLQTGCSLVDYEMREMARSLLWKATQSNAALHLPEDVVVSNEQRTREPKKLKYRDVPPHLAIFDIGPRAVKTYQNRLRKAELVVWSGPLGLFEDKRFSGGTKKVLSALKRHKGTTIVGGGDTLAAISRDNDLDKLSHISTGGGAMLKFLAQESLPGVQALINYGS